MKPLVYLICILMTLVTTNAVAISKHKAKKKQIKSAKVVSPFKNVKIVSPYVIAIGYPTIDGAFQAAKSNTYFKIKPNAKPFGWQERSGPWYVVNEPLSFGKQAHVEWAFTQPGHFAHPTVTKRMIDVGSKDHVYVDMAFRCGAINLTNCDQLLNEFKEVNLFIRKVYQKKYIATNDGTPAWRGVDSLE